MDDDLADRHSGDFIMDYVYYNDNQAQGRYLMPALYPLMYFVTLGWNKILTKVIKNEKVRG